MNILFSLIAIVSLAVSGSIGYKTFEVNKDTQKQIHNLEERQTDFGTEVSAAISKYVDESKTLGAAVQPYAGYTYSLYSSGVSSSASSITLSSLTIKQTGQLIRDADLSDTFYITLEPGNVSKQEIVGCTTVTQNSNGTATLSGCSRGLAPISPYTASTTLQFAHGGNTSVIFSDPPQLFNQFIAKDNNEIITGIHSYNIAPILLNEGTSSAQVASQAYANAVIAGGAPTSTATVGGKVLLATAADASQNLNASSSAWAILNPKALTTAIASSSPAVNTQLVPVASTTGYLNVNWLSTSSPNGAKNDILFGQNVFFNGTSTLGVGAPSTATTTVNNNLVINNKSYFNSTSTYNILPNGLFKLVAIGTATSTIGPMGTNIYASSTAISSSGTGTGYVKLKEIYIPIGGTINVAYNLARLTGAGSNGTGRLYINDVAVGTENTSSLTPCSSSAGTFTDGVITVKAGDRIQLYGHGDGTVEGSVCNFRIYAAVVASSTDAVNIQN